MKRLLKVVAGCAVAAPLALALAAPAGASTASVKTAKVTGTAPAGLPAAQIITGNKYVPAFPGATLKVKYSPAGSTCSSATASFVIQNESPISQQVTDRVAGSGLVGPPIAAGGSLYICMYKGSAQTFSLLSNPYKARLHVVFK
jgi:hypothetical protein